MHNTPTYTLSILLEGGASYQSWEPGTLEKFDTRKKGQVLVRGFSFFLLYFSSKDSERVMLFLYYHGP